MSTKETIPLLLDTDIGSDIDDAVCLAYLLSQPRCELLGVTTVSGEARKRAALADAVCRAADKTGIPIHSGSENAILMATPQSTCHQAEVLSRIKHTPPEEFAPCSAVPFLRDQIRSRPGEITLLAIGPMTNLGLLFAMDPEIPALLKRLVLMCGVFSTRTPNTPRNEWNSRCDPLASSITYKASAPGHLSIGLDVTKRCQRPAKACIDQFTSIGGPLSVVAAMTEVWAEKRELITFHDPLAAAVIFDPDLCKYEDGLVEVETQSTHSNGMTHFSSRAKEKPHRVAMEVDPERFFEHYFEVVESTP